MNSKKTKNIQIIIKTCILILISYYAIMHQLTGVIGAPPIHAFCPFGGLASLFKLITTGIYIKKIFPATMVLFVSTVVIAVVLRRGFCGWICPLGTLQEYFTYLGRRLKIKQNPLPRKVDSYLKYIKYVGLVIIIYFTWKTGELVFNNYDPWAAYAHIPAGFEELYDEFLIGVIFLIVGVIGSLWIPQNWCKYFCPMGAFLAILSKLSPTKLIRNKETCINCHLCSEICPVSIEVSKMDKVLTTECYQCGDCIKVCPKPNTLEYRTIFNKKISWIMYGVLSLMLFFGSVYTAKVLKIWRSGFSSISDVLIDDKGKLDPLNIKGSMTLEDVSEAFNIPMSYLKHKLGLPQDVNTKMFLRNMKGKYSISVNDVRLKVLEYLKTQSRNVN